MEEAKDIIGGSHGVKHRASPSPASGDTLCTGATKANAKKSNNLFEDGNHSTRSSPQKRKRTGCSMDICTKGAAAAAKDGLGDGSHSRSDDDDDDDDVIGALIYNSSLTASARAMKSQSQATSSACLESGESSIQDHCKDGHDDIDMTQGEGQNLQEVHQLDGSNMQAYLQRSIQASKHQALSPEGERRESGEVKNEGNSEGIIFHSSKRNGGTEHASRFGLMTTLSVAADNFRSQPFAAAPQLLNTAESCNLGVPMPTSIRSSRDMPISLDTCFGNIEMLGKTAIQSGNMHLDVQQLVKATQGLVESATADAVEEFLDDYSKKLTAQSAAGAVDRSSQNMRLLLHDLVGGASARNGWHENTFQSKPSGPQTQREPAIFLPSMTCGSSVSHLDLVALILAAYAPSSSLQPLSQPRPQPPSPSSTSAQPETSDPGANKLVSNTHSILGDDNSSANMVSDALKATDILMNSRVFGSAKEREEYMKIRVRELVEKYPQILEESAMNEIKQSFYRRIMLISKCISHCCHQRLPRRK